MSPLVGTVAGAQILAALYLYTRPKHEELLPGAKAAPIEARLFRRPTSPAQPPAAAPVKVPAVAGVPQPRRSSTCRSRRRPLRGPSCKWRRVFARRGDTTNAIAKLQQATALDPGNAEILAELAMTYESMQLFDRSNEVWRSLQSLGPAVGPLFELADLKLQVGVPPQGDFRALPPNGGVILTIRRDSRRLDLRHFRVDLETRDRSRRGDSASLASGGESAAGHADRSHQG